MRIHEHMKHLLFELNKILHILFLFLKFILFFEVHEVCLFFLLQVLVLYEMIYIHIYIYIVITKLELHAEDEKLSLNQSKF